MQDTILTILESASKWMTASDIAEKGKYRSAGNVGVCLKDLGDRVVSRKSPTRKQLNGMPAVEWRHADKSFGDDRAAEPTTEKSSAVEMPTDKECCNAAKVVATTAGSEVAKLNAEIKRLMDANHGLAIESHDRKQRIEKLEADQSYREGVIADLNDKLGHALTQIDALNEQLMHGEEAVDVKDAARGYLVCAPKRKPAKHDECR